MSPQHWSKNMSWSLFCNVGDEGNFVNVNDETLLTISFQTGDDNGSSEVLPT